MAELEQDRYPDEDLVDTVRDVVDVAIRQVLRSLVMAFQSQQSNPSVNDPPSSFMPLDIHVSPAEMEYLQSFLSLLLSTSSTSSSQAPTPLPPLPPPSQSSLVFPPFSCNQFLVNPNLPPNWDD